MTINVQARTSTETELMVKLIDRWYRHFFNVMGVKRMGSHSERQAGRAEITIEISVEGWNYIYNGAMFEITNRLEKGTCYYKNQLSTCEVL